MSSNLRKRRSSKSSKDESNKGGEETLPLFYDRSEEGLTGNVVKLKESGAERIAECGIIVNNMESYECIDHEDVSATTGFQLDEEMLLSSWGGSNS